MAESIDSRKFERKTQFDVPLPIRKVQRKQQEEVDDDLENGYEVPPVNQNTMAFSLMTKKGNRQQTKTIELPSDSNFAVSMKTQQEAQREEQQRIKNLVLNYDMRVESDRNDSFDFERYDNSLTRAERSGRQAPRARRLDLKDVDWT